jgi:hypothetical protein
MEQIMSYENFNWFTVGSFIVLALMAFVQSYVNIAKNQFSNFFIDAAMLLFLSISKGKSAVNREKRNIQKIHRIGYLTLAGGLLSLYYAIDWYVKYIK